jgi:hypothetical protein
MFGRYFPLAATALDGNVFRPSLLQRKEHHHHKKNRLFPHPNRSLDQY